MSDSSPLNEHPPPPSPGSFRIVGLVVGAAMLVMAFAIPAAFWIDWFQHPIRVERMGRIPETTVAGVAVLRIALVLAAVTWILISITLGPIQRRHPQPGYESEATTGRGTLAILVAAIAIGLILRGIRLQESLWYDEIAAMISSSLFGPGPALGNYHALANHAFHSALAAISLQTLGATDAELALRLPAFLAGIACIPAMFALGRSIDGDRLGLLAATVMAVMPVAILESVEARGYSLMMLCAILATLQWLRIADGRPFAIMAYALFVALGCWSHLVFACIPLGHAMQALVRAIRLPEDRPAAIRWALALALGGATTLIVIAPLLPDLVRQRTEFVALDGDEPSPLGIEGFHAFLQLGGSWTWWAAIPGLGLLLIGLTEAARWPRLQLAAHAGIAGGLVAFAFALVGGSWIYARFLVFMLVPAALLIAAALRGAGHFGRRAEPAILAGGILMITWFISLAVLPSKQPIREGVDRLRALTGADGTAWSIGLGDDVAMFYTEGRGPKLLHAPKLGANLEQNTLAIGPDAAIMLYPDLVSETTLAKLRIAGFEPIERYEGWLDWGRGDVAIWSREPGSTGN